MIIHFFEQRRREVNATIGTPFRNIHAIMHPSASGGTVVQLPPKAPDKFTMDRGGTQVAQQQNATPASDLLGGESQEVKKEENAQLTDFFDSVSISAPSSVNVAHRDSNPFNSFAPVPTSTTDVMPTIAQLPINPPRSSHVQVQHQGQVSHFGSPPGASFPYQQGHAPQMFNQNNTGISGHPQPGAYQPHPQHVAPSFYQHQSPAVPALPQTNTQQTLQQPQSSNISQFDPFAKR